MIRTIAVLIFPQFQLLDATGPITVFEVAGRETAPATYRLRLMARVAGPVVSSSGAQLIAEPLLEEPLDTLLVVGGRGTREAHACPQTLAYVRAAAARARRTA